MINLLFSTYPDNKTTRRLIITFKKRSTLYIWENAYYSITQIKRTMYMTRPDKTSADFIIMKRS